MSYIQQYPDEISGYVGLDACTPTMFLEEEMCGGKFEKHDPKTVNWGSMAIVNEYNEQLDNAKKLKDFKFSKKLDVLLILSTFSSRYMKGQLSKGMYKSSLKEMNEKLVSNAENQKIIEMEGPHFLHHKNFRGLSEKIENIADKIFENKIDTTYDYTKLKSENEIKSVLNLKGTKNTRDLGGYAAGNQKITKENVFLRSDNTNNLSESDIQQLKEKHNLKYVVDLRYDSEIKTAPDKLNDIEGIIYHNVPLCIPKDQMKELIDDGSLLFHCTNGKDRTGLLSALLIGLCGVSDEDIVKNYSLTYELIKDSESVKKGIEKYGTDVIFKSSSEYMSKFLTYVNQQHGSIKNYLINECGISQENINKIPDKFTSLKSLDKD